jgi:hypothetical protein
MLLWRIIKDKQHNMIRQALTSFILGLGLFTLGVPASLSAQGVKNLWQTLGKITYKKVLDESLGFKVDVPIFSEEIKVLEGKTVEVKGYIIPVEGYKNHKEFVFSAFPYSMCFFCGGAGPETVMEVFSQEPIKYSAESITIKGKLSLNDSDINRLIYSLSDAVLISKPN